LKTYVERAFEKVVSLPLESTDVAILEMSLDHAERKKLICKVKRGTLYADAMRSKPQHQINALFKSLNAMGNDLGELREKMNTNLRNGARLAVASAVVNLITFGLGGGLAEGIGSFAEYLGQSDVVINGAIECEDLIGCVKNVLEVAEGFLENNFDEAIAGTLNNYEFDSTYQNYMLAVAQFQFEEEKEKEEEEEDEEEEEEEKKTKIQAAEKLILCI